KIKRLDMTSILQGDLAASFGAISSVGVAGIDFEPGSDTNSNLLTVIVSGAPTLVWDESADAFSQNKDLIILGPAGGKGTLLLQTQEPFSRCHDCWN
ncbi:MAG: hypothetical protein V3S51_02105, partial [Dehalococcoidia bacterium]